MAQPKKRTVVRSSITGQFEKKEEATRRPNTTQTETLRQAIKKIKRPKKR